MVDSNGFWEALSRCSSGDRAALRRCAGTRLCEANGQAVMIFYRCLPGEVPVWQEDRWFAAACFSCLWDGEEKGQPMEAVLSRLKEYSDSMEHRLGSILELRWEEDGFLLSKLARILKMAKSKGLPVDCRKLLEDLIFWNSSNQSVKKKWARGMYIKNSDFNRED